MMIKTYYEDIKNKDFKCLLYLNSRLPESIKDVDFYPTYFIFTTQDKELMDNISNALDNNENVIVYNNNNLRDLTLVNFTHLSKGFSFNTKDGKEYNTIKGKFEITSHGSTTLMEGCICYIEEEKFLNEINLPNINFDFINSNLKMSYDAAKRLHTTYLITEGYSELANMNLNVISNNLNWENCKILIKL